MTLSSRISAFFDGWLDAAATGAARINGLIARPKVIKLIAAPEGGFAISGGRARGRLRFEDSRISADPVNLRTLRGAHVELALPADIFVFAPLELPRRARDFLGGVVRSQIDRLTPWRASAATIGWSAPRDISGDRLATIVAAAPREHIEPYIRALAASGIDSLKIFTKTDEEPAASIEVHASAPGAEARHKRWRGVMIVALLIASGAAIAAELAAVWFDPSVRRDALMAQISARRAALIDGRGGPRDRLAAATIQLKRGTPADVVVIDALTKALPDDAYLTELRIENGKMQIAGLTQDAPGLVRRIEQSHDFTHAAFYAPTTRSEGEANQRFHIEARVQPTLAVAP